MNSGRECGASGRVQTYGHAAVSTDDGDVDGRSQGGITEFFSDKGRGTNNIQGGDTEDPRKGSVL